MASDHTLPQPAPADRTVRIVSFNVNGLRAFLRRRYGDKATIAHFLQDAGCADIDILCLQETKLRRAELAVSRELALCDGWESFFSCATSNRGYSGTATFCRTATALPFAAEEGFSGGCAPGCTGPVTSAHPCLEPHFDVAALKELDSEGRVTITDHGRFVLFNIYAPAITSQEAAEARMQFKADFFRALQLRWEACLFGQGKGVVAVGDFNVTPAPLDFPDPDPDFYRATRPDRRWLRSLLHRPPDQPTPTTPSAAGRFTDVFRAFHPTRTAAYTVWSTATNARVNNYGSRIDLVLTAGLPVITPGKHTLPPHPGGDSLDTGHGQRTTLTSAAAVKSLEQPVSGSEFQHDTLWVSDSDIQPEVLGSDHCPVWVELRCAAGERFPCADAPPLGAMSGTYVGKQTKLHQWLVGRHETSGDASSSKREAPDYISHNPGVNSSGAGRGGALERAKTAPKQAGLHAFFQTQQASVNDAAALAAASPLSAATAPAAAASDPIPCPLDASFVQAELAASESSLRQQQSQAKSQWTGILTKMQGVPNCRHNEPAALKRVGKSGPNHGRYFYTCAHPDGAGPEGQCGFFRWVEPRPGDAVKTTGGAGGKGGGPGGGKRQRV